MEAARNLWELLLQWESLKWPMLCPNRSQVATCNSSRDMLILHKWPHRCHKDTLLQIPTSRLLRAIHNNSPICSNSLVILNRCLVHILKVSLTQVLPIQVLILNNSYLIKVSKLLLATLVLLLKVIQACPLKVTQVPRLKVTLVPRLKDTLSSSNTLLKVINILLATSDSCVICSENLRIRFPLYLIYKR